MHRFVSLIGIGLLTVLSQARAEEPDDEYVRIYNLVQQADGLMASGQSSEAKEKYREAQNSLQTFQKGRPDWHPQVVQFRLRYLAEKLQPLSADVGSRTETPEKAAPRPPETDESTQIKLLQTHVRQLTADRELLKAKLKEALSAQPAAVDPRELRKAEERTKSLEKEIELLRVNLRKAERKPDNPVDLAVFEETQKALADANAKLKQQNESLAALNLEKQALQERLRALADVGDIAMLKEENRKLRQQVDELKAGSAAADLSKRIATLQTDLATYKSSHDILLAEKKILENRLSELASLRETELRTKTRGSERELADAKAAAQAHTATALAILRARVDVLEARKVP